MNMTRAAAVSIHAVSPEFISIGTTHNLPLCLCEKVITSGREAVLRPCYSGIKQLLRWPPPHRRPKQQWSKNRISLVILSGHVPPGLRPAQLSEESRGIGRPQPHRPHNASPGSPCHDARAPPQIPSRRMWSRTKIVVGAQNDKGKVSRPATFRIFLPSAPRQVRL